MFRQRYQKYHNKSSSYNGTIYHSKAEAGYAIELDQRKKAGDIKEWAKQLPIELRVNGRLICKYICDFEILHNDDSIELVEIKGFETEVYRLKRKLLEATYLLEYPDRKYTVIKV